MFIVFLNYGNLFYLVIFILLRVLSCNFHHNHIHYAGSNCCYQRYCYNTLFCISITLGIFSFIFIFFKPGFLPLFYIESSVPLRFAIFFMHNIARSINIAAITNIIARLKSSAFSISVLCSCIVYYPSYIF